MRPSGAFLNSTSGEDARQGIVCPECQSPVFAKEERLHCPACQRSWPVVNGIAHFVSDFPYWGEIPCGQMREVNRRAAHQGWKAALLESGDPVVLKAAAMITNLDRANWQMLASVPRQG